MLPYLIQGFWNLSQDHRTYKIRREKLTAVIAARWVVTITIPRTAEC